VVSAMTYDLDDTFDLESGPQRVPEDELEPWRRVLDELHPEAARG